MMPQQNYTVLVRQLKEEIHSARIRASLSANVHLLVLYWKIGKAILQSQEAEGWGAKVIDNLAKDLRSEFPDMKGISSRNLKYMRSFAEAYPEFVQVPPAQKEKNQIVQEPLAKKGKGKFVQPPVAQTGNKQFVQPLVAQFNQEEILQQAVAKITWSHNVVLLDRVKNGREIVLCATGSGTRMEP